MPADGSKETSPDLEAFAKSLSQFAEESSRAWASGLSLMAEQARQPGEAGLPPEMAKAAAEFAQSLDRMIGGGAQPSPAASATDDFATALTGLWTDMLRRIAGEHVEPEPLAPDRRFADPEWSENPFFDFLRRAHLLTVAWTDRQVRGAGLDERTRRRLSFHLGEILNALAPSNFLLTNPVLLRETRETEGANLVRGMQMWTEDMLAGGGHLRIRHTEPGHFTVGKNLAATPGRVVFRNALFELIQYAPLTPEVRRRPLLIVPPWINKFYILDLAPGKSLIEWAVGEGLTVFCMSWVNPDETLRAASFADYMRDGVVAAAEVVREITRCEEIDGLGYCIGGTLLAISAAASAGAPSPFASLTLLAAQLDFTHAGDLKLFVEDGQLEVIEQRMEERGFVEGQDLARAFNHLRSNELIWPFYVDVYLRGRPPRPFDVLYWNADTTRVPAANHAFYLRQCYLQNALAEGRLEVGGTPIDLRKVTVPVYSVAAQSDHIVSARSVFVGVQLLGGPARFVLARSGHIAGIINPPARKKYGYWTGAAPQGDDLEAWLAAADETPGSWWPDWMAWLRGLDARTVRARKVGSRKHPPMEDAPGTYVHVRT